MNVSQKDAQDSLATVKETMTKTHRAIASSYASDLLIRWGLILVLAYLGTHFFLAWVSWIWSILCGIGTFVTFLLFWHKFRAGFPTKNNPAEKLGWRTFWFWFFLYAYIFLWLVLLGPPNGLKLNAFLLTAVMFAYVVMGLWFKEYYMLWLGLAVTLFTLVGVYLIPHNYYCLWMAPMAGGTLFGTGLYTRLRWR